MTTTSESPLWTPRAVAASLGISVATLRTWDSRYGLGPSERAAGRHRRYSDEDVARLRRMVGFAATGMSAAAAASAALADGPDSSPGAGSPPRSPGPQGVRGMVDAAARLDSPKLAELADRYLDEFGAARSWTELFQPVLAELGARIARGTLGIEVEHIASAAIVRALNSLPVPEGTGRIRALLAAAPEEQHTLPLYALGAALAERGAPHRNLGGRVPAESLLNASHRLKPLAVVVWAQTPVSASMVPLGELLHREDTVLVGGPGWSAASIPPGVRVISSLDEALVTLLGPSV